MENSVNENVTQASVGSQSNLLDGLSALGLLGGAIAAAVTSNVAAGTIPVAAAVGLHLVNRRQLAEQMLQNQQTATAQVIEQINQHQAALTDYLQKFQQETGDRLDQQQQTQTSHQQSLNEALAQQNEQLQQQLTSLQEQSQQVVEAEAQRHQELVAVVNELHHMENCSHSLEAAPQADAYYQRGLSHQNLGDRPEALCDFSTAIRLDAELAGAYFQRGIIYAELGDRKPAVEDLRQAAKLFFDQGDLEQYDRARELGKEFYDLQEPFSGDTAKKEEVPVAGSEDDEAPHFQPLLVEEINVTAESLFS